MRTEIVWLPERNPVTNAVWRIVSRLLPFGANRDEILLDGVTPRALQYGPTPRVAKLPSIDSTFEELKSSQP